jgi:hypothetical protein
MSKRVVAGVSGVLGSVGAQVDAAGRGLATRYDKLAIVYRSAVVLHAVITWTEHLSDTP